MKVFEAVRALGERQGAAMLARLCFGVGMHPRPLRNRFSVKLGLRTVGGDRAVKNWPVVGDIQPAGIIGHVAVARAKAVLAIRDHRDQPHAPAGCRGEFGRHAFRIVEAALV
ncbi:MAG: hypothetical protein ACOYM3_34660, partial [Terrimicrobiaceae bacterium]